MKELRNFSAVKWRNLFSLEKSLDWKEKSYSNLCMNKKKKKQRKEREEKHRQLEEEKEENIGS